MSYTIENPNLKPTYLDFYQKFTQQNLLKELYKDTSQDALNAYNTCCGRHVRQGLGEKVALVHEDTEQQVTELTYQELAEKSAQVAHMLTHYGVRAGDRVATMLPRTPELLIIVLATWRIGAIYQPLFTAFGVESIQYRLDKADTKIVFTNLENREKFIEIDNLPQMVLVEKNDALNKQDIKPDAKMIAKTESQINSKANLSNNEAEYYADANFAAAKLYPTEFEPVTLDENAPFLQMFTSGTVGKSKGVSVPLCALSTFYLYMRYAIDLREADNYWNMADPGWAYCL